MNQVEKQVLDSIDVDGMLEYICELISIKSLTGDEAEAQANVAAKMKSLGMKVDKWILDLEKLREHPDFSMEVNRTEGIGVVGIMGEYTGGKSLILNGHIDVVHAGDEANWEHPPWEGTIDSGKVYGRGSTDMKGGLACALYAAKAIKDAGVKLKGKLIIESVVGEEDGGVGALAAVLRGYQADGAVIMEPTELKIAPAQAGALCFKIKVHGHSAHACVREEGVSALEKFIPIFNALLELEKTRNERVDDPLYSNFKLPIPLNMGKVESGNWPSTVPESLLLEGRYGVAVGEDIEAAKQEFLDALEEVIEADPWLKEHRPDMEWWGGQFKPANIPVDDPIVKTVESAFKDTTGSAPVFEGVTYGSDMRHLVNVGDTPTVLFGPGDVRYSHRPNEFVPVDELVTTVKTLALIILRFCGY
ncbi:MAG: peptidase [Candidatus Bathyarchaeota archaeon]|nr:peptidase [Candidatus Bathyarchaeota archaeon]